MKYKRTDLSVDYRNYALARSEYNITNKVTLKSNPKAFHKFVNLVLLVTPNF